MALSLAEEGDVIEGVVVREPKAYPVYDDGYEARVDTIRTALAHYSPNLHVVGRAGMHKYNNQDHAMMTAMLTVKNILADTHVFDVWSVNQDAEYHEEKRGDSGTRLVPMERRS
jgi:protoporphyrinogen oxidase